MDRTEPIKNYILFLITQCGLSVTLHPLESERVIGASELMQFNIHDNAYCALIKSTKEGKARCHLQQQRVLAHCRKTQKSFCGVCHAGVFEFVYPLFDGKNTIGFLSVSGYRAPHLKNGAALSLPQKNELEKVYHGLKRQIPDQKWVDTLLHPLCQMLELALRKNKEDAHREETPIDRICRYLRQNFAADVTLDGLCREFSCSRSYLSHAFKRETGKSVGDYLTDVRVENAKHLLCYCAMNITQIAFSTGFSDSNYFSTVFKKRVGLSPLAYRRSVQKE